MSNLNILIQKIDSNITHKSKYWYVFYIEECVDCGWSDTIKQRVYIKPKDEDKYNYSQYLCSNCS